MCSFILVNYMKKLLLTSTGFTNPQIAKTFLQLVHKKHSDITVLFIPTAARTDEELSYVKESKKELHSLGIRNIVVINLNRCISYHEINNADCMYVCGGNTFYLLHKIRETGFGEVVKKFVEDGKVYVGVSAGSIIAGPDISVAEPFDKNDVCLSEFTGLLLTNNVVSPHYSEKERHIVDKIKRKSKYKIITLTDNQALLIVGETETIVE